jgi:hypothetical protein
MRNFSDMFSKFSRSLTEEMVISEEEKPARIIEDSPKSKSPEKILRDSNIKIKYVTPTNFGTEITLAKHYDETQIEKLLAKYNVYMKNNSIFIIN